MAALAAGDMDAVVRLLHPDVTFTGDSNRRAPTAARVIHGPDKVVRFLFGLARPLRSELAVDEPAGSRQRPTRQLHRRRTVGDGYPEMTPRVTAMTVRDGKVCAMSGCCEPGQVHCFAAPVPSAFVAQGTRQASPEPKPCSVIPSAEYIRARMFSTPI